MLKLFNLDYDTDEETDKLLGIEHRMNARNQEVREAVRRKLLLNDEC